MSANITLNYFAGRGRAEITRLIFAAAGIKFNDNRIDGADWPTSDAKAAAPLGQMPFLEVNHAKIPQSIAIARFAAREAGIAGDCNLSSAYCDAIVDTIMDLVNFYYGRVFSIKDEDEKATAFASFLGDQGAKGAANIEKLISLYGSNGFAVGGSLTWADLAIFDITSALFAKVPSFASAYPLLSAVHAQVAANANVAAYVAARPVTPF